MDHIINENYLVVFSSISFHIVHIFGRYNYLHFGIPNEC